MNTTAAGNRPLCGPTAGVQQLIHEIMAGVKEEEMYKSTLNVQVKPV
jgi:hypothetical protein